MRVGLNLAHFAAPGGSTELGANLTRVAQRAEAAGFESLWVWDHLLWCRAPIGAGILSGHQRARVPRFAAPAGRYLSIEVEPGESD